MTGNMEEWFPGGTILYSESHKIPRLRIITKDHVYEMQACKFDPIMQVFSILVDGKHKPSKYDSLDRFMQLDEASKDGKCSERERILNIQNQALRKQLTILMRELANLKLEVDDTRMIMFSSIGKHEE